jgi:alkyl hydroperoxide reductase subunit AhpF
VQPSYWRPDTGRYVDGGGRPFPLPSPDADRSVTVVERYGRRILDGHGRDRRGVTLQDTHTGRREEVAVAALFVLIGAQPHTEWLRDSSHWTTVGSS